MAIINGRVVLGPKVQRAMRQLRYAGAAHHRFMLLFTKQYVRSRKARNHE